MCVAEVMKQWPETVPVFIRRRMACPGCIFAPFMTVREAAKEYGLGADEFASDLGAVIDKANSIRRRD
ncbi:MAG: DUF1858 domain-containing protein [Alphaproteobacteria bacterium]|nr:DUF1858 domain-containing protein [Alphaproteobacteria bacterium]